MSTEENKALITTFYQAFQELDARTMISCYHNDVTFSDPVFTHLKGEQAKSMWAMLCESATDLRVTFGDVHADEESGQAHWEATYTFSATGKPVHNVIDTRFVFKDGKIFTHTDRFDLRRWCSMALGGVGKLFGWSAMLQGRVRAGARQNLDRYMEKRGRES